MRRLIVIPAVVFIAAVAFAGRASTAANAGAPIVFFDIAGPDAAKLKDFYASNFGWDIASSNMIQTPKLPTPTGEQFVLFRDPAGNRMGMVGTKK